MGIIFQRLETTQVRAYPICLQVLDLSVFMVFREIHEYCHVREVYDAPRIKMGIYLPPYHGSIDHPMDP